MSHYRSRARLGRRYSPQAVFIVLVLAAVVVGLLYVATRMVRAPRPTIALAAPFEVVGRNALLGLDVRDAAGLRSLRVVLRQDDQEHTLVEETYDPPRTDVHREWRLAGERRFRLREGPGTVTVEAKNASWGNFFRGKSATLEKTFTAKLTPPRLEALTTQHYVNQGGADLVVYRVTPPEAESGVQSGEAWFKGFAMPGAADPAVRFALFAHPYDAPPGTAARLQARDDAGNEAAASFNVKVFPKSFRTRTLTLGDAFLQRVVPEILGQTPDLTDRGSLLENFLQINRDLRAANNKTLAEMARRSEPRRLWTQPFRQLSNSQVEASFADHRIYVYQGREVDRQDHLGYDLATTQRAPVSASNDGVVMMAEYFGIYGNTVVLDHGYGLLTLYGHLSSFAIRAGDTVTRGQEIGRSGASGLAGGDHLHFSVILQGEQVDAREWWDPHWIEDRLEAKLRPFGAPPAVPAASPRPEPAPAAR
ncbi:MAG TPA: M23 family metallopeptidase [Vicinamibacteria bacterium]|nr:M23 family metallopeptidase [Vicinamibacteria bacterium]